MDIKIDRLDGLSSATAIKGPCRVATTEDITLYGLQVVDGVQLVRRDRVLVKDQDNPKLNGIWAADTGSWKRTKDFSRNDDVRRGTIVNVTDGTTNQFTTWYVVSENPIIIDTTDILFSQSPLFLRTTITPFSATIQQGSSDTIDLGAEDIIDNGVILFLDGVGQEPIYTVTDGVITPVGTWPDFDGGTIRAFGWYFNLGALSGSVPNGVIDRLKLRVNFRKSVSLAPQEYGAVGDGGDDTDSLVEWAAACQDEGLTPALPPGEYTCGSVLDFSNKGGLIRGAGEGKTIVRFTNALSGGFKCHPVADSGEGLGIFSVEHLTLRSAPGVVVPIAIDCVLPNNGRWSNNYRTGFRYLEIRGEGTGTGAGYFATGIRERNVSYSERRKVKYWGSEENPTAQSGYYAGTGFDFDTQLIADNPLQGAALENQWYGCTADFCNTGIKFRGYPEGLYLHGNHFAFVRKGIDAQAYGTTRQPLVSILSNHINATEFCILLDGFSQSSVVDNHLSRPGEAGIIPYVWVGVDLVNSLGTKVTINRLLTEAILAGSGNMYGVRVSGDSWASVTDNYFAGAMNNSGTYKYMTAGLLLEPGVQATKFTADNQFTGYYDIAVQDNSGNGTNQSYLSVIPGVSVLSDGVLVGTAGGTKIINFSDDFVVAEADGSVTVSLAP